MADSLYFSDLLLSVGRDGRISFAECQLMTECGKPHGYGPDSKCYAHTALMCSIRLNPTPDPLGLRAAIEEGIHSIETRVEEIVQGSAAEDLVKRTMDEIRLEMEG